MFLTTKTPSTRRKTKKERKLSVLCAFAVHFVSPPGKCETKLALQWRLRVVG
jgi:hypothetical protein